MLLLIFITSWLPPQVCSVDTRPTILNIARTSIGVPTFDGVPGSFDTINFNSAFLDLNTIYGSDDATAARLRANSSGRLLMENTSFQLYLPFRGINALPAMEKVPGAVLYNFTYEDLLPSMATTGRMIGV